MPNLWRLHIRPYGGGNNDPAASVNLCLDRSIIGMGWAVPDDGVRNSNDLNWFRGAANRQYQGDTGWRAVCTFAEQLQLGDLVWFRSLEGRYYLAVVKGPWQYSYEDENAISVDIVNFREVRVIDVGLADAVPGKIIACFRPSRTLQRINSPGMLLFSKKLAGMLVNEDKIHDIFEFMSDKDIEDIVFMYLQFLGWYVVPNTRTATTAHYEFVLINRESCKRATVQVKSGHTPINAGQYSGQDTAFLFATSEKYGDKIPQNVKIIDKKKLLTFMQKNPQLLPRAANTWIEIAGHLEI